VEGLLEREDELGALSAAVEQALAGRGGLALVAGEAGIGKTALVRALRERVAGRAAFMAGACEPLSVPAPLAPVRELMEAAGVEAGPEVEDADRLALAGAVLDALGRRAPAVAVIEDAHWADPSTLDVVRLLARRLTQRPLALVVTYRDDEVAANLELGRLLGDLATRRHVRIALRPLSPVAVRVLAEPAGIDPLALRRATGGNPFLVVEAIAAGGGLPGSVSEAVLARASRLGRGARAAVEAAAVIGSRFRPALLEAVQPQSAEAVEEALARGVLVSEGAVLGFRHELIREALEASIPAHRRAELHARVLGALEARPGRADSARLAHHADLAGLEEKACAYAMRAAQHAARLGALHEVALQSRRALRLGAGLDAGQRLDLLVGLSHALNFSSTRLEDAVEAAEEAIALAVRGGDSVGHGRALIALAYALWSLDRLAGARAAAAEAIEVLEPAGDDAALARAHATATRIEATAFDPAAALASGARALELADRADMEETRIDVAISLGLARGHLGEAEALGELAEACRQARRAGLTIQTVRSYVNQAFVGALLRRHAFVDEVAGEAGAIFEELGTTIPGWAIELYRARSLLDRGRWEEARAVAASREDWVAETATAWTIVALIDLRRGDLSAVGQLQRAWRELGGVPEGSRHAAVRVALAEAAWLTGDPALAAALRGAPHEPPADARLAGPPAAAGFARPAAELALWAWRLGLRAPVPDNAPPPVRLELAGDWRAAIRAWREAQAPYEAALAALPGDERAARGALLALRRLGAEGAIRAFSRHRIARGARPSRPPRRFTMAHPAGLTRREQEVLDQLATGATNPAIAATLHLSERTVAHHVSAILSKLDAGTRLAAVQRARALGLLAEDGQLEGPR